ncbi:hypothetical protein CYMTET_10004 [Cymbomonas tetramitiformis]|uniref:Globin domain-containing protein n=1 Tax=Cymbomonas tetramitiformis TaxID=36881 RepID=A0AAE0GQ00_9CHLO|nr:hypothetical protein CYMTET_10004 [Cymbomonas tetramitiformis]|eukprot:gene18867-22541_t
MSEDKTKILVQSSWAKVLPDVNDKSQVEKVGVLLFKRIFELAPGARELFSFADSKEETPRGMVVHGAKVIQTVDTAVKMLDEPDKLIPVLQRLGKAHVGYGVVEAHYPVVGAALLWALEQALGPAWTAETKTAWTNIYDLIATTMIEASGKAESILEMS